MQLLVALSVVLGALVALAISGLDPERLSALGSIIAGAGSLLAVLWFSAGLRYQARQLSEQQKQFAIQFEYLKETGRRDALLLVQSILERAEVRAVAALGEQVSVSEIPARYMIAVELKSILESADAQEVIHACTQWIKKESAALTLLQGIKSAAEVYLRSIGITDVDYSKSPEDFYFIYGPRFSNEPFFNTLSSTATVLAEIMVHFKPGRDVTIIALMAATAKSVSPDVVKMDKLRADIARHKADGRPLPVIARDV